MRWMTFLLAAMMLATPLAIAAKGSEEGKAGGRDQGAQGNDHGAEEAREHGPRFHAHADKWVLRNDNVTIWFHQGESSKPALAVFRTGEDGNKSGFKLQLDELFEAKAMPAANATPPAKAADAEAKGPDNGTRENETAGDDGDDHDGAAFHRARGHRINLNPAKEWSTSVQNGTEEVTITMTHLFNQGNLSLVFHVPTNGSAVKFDVDVQDWKWADANDTLALRLKVLERGAEEREHGNASFAGGFVSWAPTAQVTYPNGTSATIPVRGEVQKHDEGARILLRFDAAGGYSKLSYDPVIGVQSSSVQNVPGFDGLAMLAALGVAALVVTRRRA